MKVCAADTSLDRLELTDANIDAEKGVPLLLAQESEVFCTRIANTTVNSATMYLTLLGSKRHE